MQLELESGLNPTPTNAFIAAIVALTFYFLSLFSVYHRNQEYQKQKMSANKNKSKSKSTTTLTSKSNVKCPVAACASGPINDDLCDKENITDNNEHFSKNNVIFNANKNKNKSKSETGSTSKSDSKCAVEPEIADINDYISDDPYHRALGETFNANAIISAGKMRNRNKYSSEKTKQKKSLPKVENLGCITLRELNKYDCNHESRQLVSIFGTIFDVTAATDKYGKDGVYKEFAGHDITLCLGTGKLDPKWLDRFVQFQPKHKQSAKGWIDLYQMQYPTAGILEKWSENTKKWPQLTAQELTELNAECIVM